MKKKLPFLRDCGIGAVMVSILLFGGMALGSYHGIARNFSPVALIAPYLFIPLLVSVLYDSRYLCKNYEESKEKHKEKHKCLSRVGVLFFLTLITSIIVLYYGW
jgi:uncharacterized membrane protein